MLRPELLYDLREAAIIQTGHRGCILHLQVVFYQSALKLDLKMHLAEADVPSYFPANFPQDCLNCRCRS